MLILCACVGVLLGVPEPALIRQKFSDLKVRAIAVIGCLLWILDFVENESRANEACGRHSIRRMKLCTVDAVAND